MIKEGKRQFILRDSISSAKILSIFTFTLDTSPQLPDVIQFLKHIKVEESIHRLYAAIAIARIENEKLYKQEINPKTGKPYESPREYYASESASTALGFLNDRKRRSDYKKIGNGILNAVKTAGLDLQTTDLTDHFMKFLHWEAACKHGGNPKDILQKLFELSFREFKTFAQGKKTSGRLETPPKLLFQQYYLGES